MVKIAVASTDGKVVNQHFGRADKFYILATDEDTADYFLDELRNVNPVCHGGDHEEGQMEHAVNNLSDCHIVLVSRIGMRARNEFERIGIEVFEIPQIIDKAVEQLICYRKVQKLFYEKEAGCCLNNKK